jgi:hypothetical protein
MVRRPISRGPSHILTLSIGYFPKAAKNKLQNLYGYYVGKTSLRGKLNGKSLLWQTTVETKTREHGRKYSTKTTE